MFSQFHSGRFVLASLPLPATTLGSIFGFAIGNGLPLHVRWSIGSTAFQRLYVVNDISTTGTRTLSGRGAGLLPFEGVLRCCAAPDSASGCPWIPIAAEI
jgi:hypothetical protein